MLSLSRSLCSLRFSLLKTKNIYHYALIFFFISHIFFLSLNHFFFTNIFFFHLIMLSFFFQFGIFFFSVSTSLFNNFFFHYALIMLSSIYIFYFQFFHFCLRGDPLRFFIFQFFQLQHQLFQMNYDHSFYYYYIDEKYQYLLFV